MFDENYWETRDGRKIAIKEMGTSHIENTINMLRYKTIPSLKLEKEKIDAYMDEFVDDNNAGFVYMSCVNAIDDAYKYIKVFEEELKKRK